MLPDGTLVTQMPGTDMTIGEFHDGVAALEAELNVVEPGAPGSDTSNVGPPPSSGDAELDDLRAQADRLLPALNDAGDGDVVEYDDDASDDGELVDASEYADPAEIDDEPDASEGETGEEEADDSSQELMDGLTRADADVLDSVWIPKFKELGIDPDQARELVSVYAAHQVQRAALDRGEAAETKAALAEMLGGKAQLGVALEEIGAFLGDPERISPQLADALVSARMPNGGRLINDPGFALLLLGFAKASGEDRIDDAVAYQELQEAMNHDIDAFKHEEYKGSGKTGSELMLALERRYSGHGRSPSDDASIGAPASSEEAALDALLNSNIDEYRWGNWRNSGKSASERALELARRRAGG
jgi:hypothetical protein